MSVFALAAAAAGAFGAGLLTAWLARRRAVPSITQTPGPAAAQPADPDGDDRHTRDLVLAAMDEGVVLIDDGGAVRYSNPAAVRLVGRMAKQRHDSTEDDSGAYVPPVLRVLVDECRRAGSIREREIEMGRPARTVLASSFPVGSDGLALLVLRDVTESRRVDAIRRDFVAAASHELKTPVASIQASAETLTHALDEDPAAARRFVDNLLRDSERLSRIVRDLLDLSRLEAEHPSHEPVAFDDIVREEVQRVRSRANETSLAMSLDAGPVQVRGSAEDLALLASNLLDNAIRFTRAGGRIDVRLESTGRLATLTVSDTGVGIPTRDLPRVFERFYRVDRARSRDTGGTGLGLAIVKHVAEQHGGSVEAMSELGRGSTFVVRIPLSS